MMIWNDEHLTWNESDFNGLEVIRLSSSEVFKPDITLYNSADLTNMVNNLAPTHVLVYPQGTVMWVPPATFKSICDLDLTNYPFDEQQCFLKFGSWVYDGLGLDLQLCEIF